MMLREKSLRSAAMGIRRRRTSVKMRRPMAGVLVATLTLFGVVTFSHAASAKDSDTRSTYLLYVGHGVGVIATENLTTGCSEVFISTDFDHWRNITPPLGESAVRSPNHSSRFVIPRRYIRCRHFSEDCAERRQQLSQAVPGSWELSRCPRRIQEEHQ